MEIKPSRQPEKKLLSRRSGDRPSIWFSLLDLNNIWKRKSTEHTLECYALPETDHGRITPQTKSSTATSRQSVNRYRNKG